jgi:hypothetical protein
MARVRRWAVATRWIRVAPRRGPIIACQRVASRPGAGPARHLAAATVGPVGPGPHQGRQGAAGPLRRQDHLSVYAHVLEDQATATSEVLGVERAHDVVSGVVSGKSLANRPLRSRLGAVPSEPAPPLTWTFVSRAGETRTPDPLTPRWPRRVSGRLTLREKPWSTAVRVSACLTRCQETGSQHGSHQLSEALTN